MAHKSKTQRKRAHDRKEARRARRDAVAPVEGATEVKSTQELKKVEKAVKEPAVREDPAAVAFLKDVRSEMARVTWPSREDVMQWSLVTIAALVFFGIYVAGLDQVVTMLLVAFTGLAR